MAKTDVKKKKTNIPRRVYILGGSAAAYENNIVKPIYEVILKISGYSLPGDDGRIWSIVLEVLYPRPSFY